MGVILMADLNQRLTLSDQVFVNAMAYVAGGGHLDEARAEVALKLVREVLPVISRGHVFLEPVAEQADRIVAISKIKDRAYQRAVYTSARYRASCALQDFFFWRLGLANEALRVGRKNEGKAA